MAQTRVPKIWCVITLGQHDGDRDGQHGADRQCREQASRAACEISNVVVHPTETPCVQRGCVRSAERTSRMLGSREGNERSPWVAVGSGAPQTIKVAPSNSSTLVQATAFVAPATAPEGCERYPTSIDFELRRGRSHARWIGCSS